MNARTCPKAFTTRCTPSDAYRLEDQGYCIIRNCIDRTTIGCVSAELDGDFDAALFGRGPFYGEHTKRFGRVIARSASAASLVLNPAILSLVGRILGPWCDTIQLNVAQAIEVNPGAPAQYPHRDQDMWRGVGRFEYLVNVMWPLTPFTADNGATLIWPDSHGPGQASLVQSGAPVPAEAEPGDAIVFLGSTLHGAGANRTPNARRGVVIGYSLGWLRAYENPTLAYPPAVARRFPPELAALAGYRQHRPNLGNFEGQCPSILLGGPIDAPLAAIDALLPEQAVELARHAQATRVAASSAQMSAADR
ncbi:phytanoyl-CoA dioxygenase [Nostoc sp. 3335mG]|nr:phytanoyl-CoA dioxygenase [Nostoc sp. 3335mG]